MAKKWADQRLSIGYNSISHHLQDNLQFFSHIHTVHLDIIKVFFLPTDAQVNCFESSIKIYIKTARKYFGVITIIRGHTKWAC